MKALLEIGLRWAFIAGIVALIYLEGKEAGEKKAHAEHVAFLEKAAAKTRDLSDKIDAITIDALKADQGREATHREIIRETSKIIDRPVYLDSCVDVDGLLILDRLAANANGEDPAASVGGTPAPAKGATHE